MASMLELFPCPPSVGYVTVHEKNGALVTSEICRSQIVPLIPDLDVPHELLRSCRSKETARSAFIGYEDSSKKRILHAWYEHGLTGILEELTNEGQPENISTSRRILSRSAGFILWTVRMINSLHGSFFPHLAMSNEDLIAEFSRNSSWKTNPVRCFAWHPHAPKFAVAFQNDCITIHTLSQTSNCDVIVPTLKHKMQKGVADLAWKLLSASVLAVACQSCILIWTVDPQSLSTRPSTSAAQVLSEPGHCPVISVAWSPQEGILVSASPTDNSIMVWDVSHNTCLPIKRVGNGGVTFLRWSPDGSKLLTACPSSMFRVWQCVSWTCEKWTNLLGRCKTACWSSDGSTVLFATAGEPMIYSLVFNVNPHDGLSLSVAKVAVHAIDVSAVNKETVDGLIRIGGYVQQMAWDFNSERLAVIFEGSSAAFVAVFQTRLRPSLIVIPCGFIRGLPDELASLVSFKPNFADGSILSVVWSSGRVAHIPLYYTPSHQVSQRITFNVDSNPTLFSRT